MYTVQKTVDFIEKVKLFPLQKQKLGTNVFVQSLYFIELKIFDKANFTIIQRRPTSRISSGVRDRVNACVLIGNSLIESAWLIADPRLINTRNVN